MGCYNDFAKEYMADIVRLAPRNEPLETPIEDPKKTTHQSAYGDYSYTRTTITKVDNA